MEKKKVLIIVGFVISIFVIILSVVMIIKTSSEIKQDKNGEVINKTKVKEEIKDNSEEENEKEEKNGGTLDLSDVYINKTKQLGLKGIIYLDPTNLDAYCDSKNYSSNDKTNGCMKWYIFDDSEDKYKIILDHNIVDKVKWNREDRIALSYENSVLKETLDNLVTNSNWKVTPRLIEINEITKIVKFEYREDSLWNSVEEFENWIHNNVFNQVTLYLKFQSFEQYAWLSHEKSYWTSSYITNGSFANDKVERGHLSISNNSDDDSAFLIYVVNSMAIDTGNTQDLYGLRPVIEVSKSLFNH